ncbi:MAG: hypothetical protein ACLQFW_04975 [Xanthobacteraceae bacterium]
MIDHVSIGVRDVARTKRFYDAVLKPLGYTCLSEGEGSLGYGRDIVTLWISNAEHPVPADMKSGLHVCFSNRPLGVKHFQTIHRYRVDVAHGLVLLFGIGTKALPSWVSKTRRNNLSRGLAVKRQQVQADVRTHLIHRPARDIVPPLGGSRFSSYRI